MAIIQQGLFIDPDCTQLAQAWDVGAAAATGSAAALNFWPEFQPGLYHPWGEVPRGIFTSSVPAGEVTLSGGGTIYSRAVPQTWPTRGALAEDWVNEGETGKIYNALFLGRTNEEAEEDRGSIWLSIISPDTDSRVWRIRMGVYTETKGQDGTRETWNYFGKNFDIDTSMYFTDQGGYPQVKAFRLFVEESEFILIAFGVSASNEVPTGQSSFVLIPLDYFKIKESRPWAGGDSESNSEEAYTPTEKYNDDIPPRDLTGKTNPYGFNGGNGLRLAVITYNQYAEILQGIYSGTAEGLLNKVAQQFYSLTGGNDHRQADEIQSIVSAVLCCHLIPRIVTYGSGTAGMQTIAGYHIFGQSSGGGVSMEIVITSGTIFSYNTPLQQITPRLNSFLDFEPYTSITLHLPFMASVNLVPSAVYGNYLFVHYSIDIYTGVLSADVIIHEPGGREYIVTTQQANIKTEIPIMGNGANGAPLANIASSVLGVARSGSVEMAAAAGAITAADELSKASTGVAVGKNTIEGIGAYLSPRSAYLIITRPNPANPASKGKAGFLEMEGGTAHLSGNVGDFTGYAEFSEVRLDGFAATDAEKAEIERLLKGGVYV